MQFSFRRCRGQVWRLKSSILRYYVGLFALCGGGLLALLASGMLKGTASVVWVAVFCALAALGVYLLGSGVTVEIDFGKRVFRFRAGGDVAFDQASGLLLSTTTREDSEVTNTWFLLHLLVGSDGRRVRSDLGSRRLTDVEPEVLEGARAMAASFRDEALRATAEELRSRLGVELVDITSKRRRTGSP